MKLKTVTLIALIFTILAAVATLGDFFLGGYSFSLGRIFVFLREISLAVFFGVLYLNQRRTEK